MDGMSEWPFWTKWTFISPSIPSNSRSKNSLFCVWCQTKSRLSLFILTFILLFLLIHLLRTYVSKKTFFLLSSSSVDFLLIYKIFVVGNLFIFRIITKFNFWRTKRGSFLNEKKGCEHLSCSTKKMSAVSNFLLTFREAFFIIFWRGILNLVGGFVNFV